MATEDQSAHLRISDDDRHQVAEVLRVRGVASWGGVSVERKPRPGGAAR